LFGFILAGYPAALITLVMLALVQQIKKEGKNRTIVRIEFKKNAGRTSVFCLA